ncbi:hypothetical protein [Actinoplanes sp. GCM10030250]|uniref:hypothetical protein n=1 Tax=Actinoplanes sp. GCM10030250 TaxID=3273376 RepID=UPI00361C6440
MADQQPVDPTAAAGVPDQTRAENSAAGPDPSTLDLPFRWSGAAAVPATGPRRSMWERLRERVSGPRAASAEPDNWATMPAVDPWADQETPLWLDTYAADTTRLDVAPPPTRLDTATYHDQAAPHQAAPHQAAPRPAAPHPAAKAADAATKAADAAEKAMGEALAAGAKVIEAAKAAAVIAAAKAAEQAMKAGQPAKIDAATANAQPTSLPAPIPAPGTYPPPSAGTGLPPSRPSKLRPWQRTTKTTDHPRIPIQPRPAPVRPAPARPAPARPAPPPWSPRPAPPRRGRFRRFMRRMTMLTVVALVLCCGGPLAYWQFPAAQQFPVTAVLPSSFADLDLRDTDAGRRAAERLAEQLQEAGSSGDAFAGIYTDKRGKRITLFGVTGWRLTPGSDVDAQLGRLADELKLKDIQSFDMGEFGVHESCGTGRLDGTSVVACTWADHGSLATVLFTRRSLTESADLVAELRSQVLTPKYWG